jgi:predicted GNAT family N-acyltransferase
LPTSTRAAIRTSRSSPPTSGATLADLFEVRLARTPSEVDGALRLRERVFAGEQGVSTEADRDGRDGEATHVVAVDGDHVIGTCRLVFRGHTARLGRMAVAPDLRGQGIGAELLRVAERAARGVGAERISLHAQLKATSLYTRDGYERRGEEFVEQGIEHVAMEKALGEERSRGPTEGRPASTGADHA